MIVTVQNVSGASINGLDAITGGPGGTPWSLNAEGGQRVKPLPYPFAHVGALANSATSIRPMHLKDLRVKKCANGSSFDASALWQDLVQRGIVTFATADQSDHRSVEDEFAAEL